MVSDEKYIVFKADSFAKWWTDSGQGAWSPTRGPVPLEDAVVIRRQDVFAPPALDSYAGSIRVACSLMAPGPARKSLESIADYFHEQAAAAWETIRKVPD